MKQLGIPLQAGLIVAIALLAMAFLVAAVALAALLLLLVSAWNWERTIRAISVRSDFAGTEPGAITARRRHRRLLCLLPGPPEG